MAHGFGEREKTCTICTTLWRKFEMATMITAEFEFKSNKSLS